MITTEIKVGFGDTDPYGVVFFATYFKYFHRGIEDFFSSCQLDPAKVFKNKRLKFGLPIVQANCRFLSPARYGDTIMLETSLISVRSKTLVFHFRLKLKGKDRVVAEGETVMVGINSRWKASSLPGSLLSRLKSAIQIPPPA